MHLSGYLSGALIGLTALLSNSTQSIDINKTNGLGSSLNRLLPRKDPSSKSSSTYKFSSSSKFSASIKSSSSSSLLRAASISSGGGGSPFRLGSNSRFPGRWAGGGGRGGVYGRRRFGSGYYGTGAPVCVENADFEFGFWPIWFPDGYCGTRSYEYPSPTLNDTRPGGEIVVVDLQPNPTYSQVSAEEKNHTYYMFGDKESVVLMMAILVLPRDQGGCNAINASPANWTFSTISEDRFEPGHVLQWYRGNSFALANTGYNNSYAYPPLNTTSPFNMSDPLPSPLLTSEYLSCLNKTIGDDVPIMDAEEKKKLPAGQIFAIVIGSIMGFMCLIWTCYLCSSDSRRGRERKNTNANIFPTTTFRSRKSDFALTDLPSYRTPATSKRRSSLTSTLSRSPSPTLKNISASTSPALSRNPPGLSSYAREPDRVARGASKTPVGHQYNVLLTAPSSPHFIGRDKMSVSSAGSPGRSRSPSPSREDRRLLA